MRRLFTIDLKDYTRIKEGNKNGYKNTGMENRR